MHANLVLENEILRGIVGSTAHGTAIEGQDDRDEMGVCIEPADFVCGLGRFEQYVYRDKPEGVRSEAGDLDLVIYSLRKFCRLAINGNPTVLLLLWLPQHTVNTDAGRRLLNLREAFVSAEAGERFLGYLVSQRRALNGERTKKVSRPELVERYGYDTKFAMHALRLGYQGIEYLTGRRLTVPTPEPYLSTLRAVRLGTVAFSEAQRLIEEAEGTLRTLVRNCDFRADRERVTTFLVQEHARHWASSE
jgi:uncharacterized protein